MDIEQLRQLTYPIVGFGFLAVVVVSRKIIQLLVKYEPDFGYWGYAALSLLPLVEIIRTLITRPTWYGYPWLTNPFLYFWIAIFSLFILMFFREKSNRFHHKKDERS
ncbi:hypothetical protein KAH55_14840 [bacterium]|nr:hypothetical protein [bacterium]